MYTYIYIYMYIYTSYFWGAPLWAPPTSVLASSSPHRKCLRIQSTFVEAIVINSRAGGGARSATLRRYILGVKPLRS